MKSIVLVRHGRSAYVHRGLLDRDGIHRWRNAYDAAGIIADDEPPGWLREAAREATMIVSSDLRRAIESAQRIAGTRNVVQSPRLREAPLWVPAFPFRAPLAVWGGVISVRWYYDRLRRSDRRGDAWQRAGEAADWLSGLAESDRVMAVTHGVMRQLIGQHLVASGWRATRRGGYAHWSAWSFHRPEMNYER